MTMADKKKKKNKSKHWSYMMRDTDIDIQEISGFLRDLIVSKKILLDLKRPHAISKDLRGSQKISGVLIGSREILSDLKIPDEMGS